MRTLERNKTNFYYATYIGKTEGKDEEDYYTGEPVIEYSAWKPFSANISPATGTSQTEQFGNSEQYDKIIVTDILDCEIDESTVLAIDIAPNERTKTTDLPVYDYIVKKKAKSLNSVSYAVSKVKVND